MAPLNRRQLFLELFCVEGGGGGGEGVALIFKIKIGRVGLDHRNSHWWGGGDESMEVEAS